MAEYFTQFSTILDVGSAEARDRALGAVLAEVRAAAAADADDPDLGLRFAAGPAPGRGGGAIWISSEDDGDPAQVVAFARACGRAFGLRGRWGFLWALSCSRPRLDAYGGGAHVLDLATGATVAWIDCEHWLAERLGAGAAEAPAPAAAEAAP